MSPISFRNCGVTFTRWRFLQQLLVAALDGALALAERDDVAVLVGEDLELDVARALDELLHVHVAVAERRRGFAGGGMEEIGQLLFACG